MEKKVKESLGTTLLHHDRRAASVGEIHTPVHTSVQYCFETAEQLIDAFQSPGGRRSVYARTGTPTVFSLEDKITLLEHGVGSVCFATGMAALSGCFFSLLQAGDHLVASKYLFGNTASLLKSLGRFGVSVDLVNPASVDAVEEALKSDTRMVFLESIANPTTVVPDLEKIGRLCQTKKIPLVVDNTVLSPILFRPKDIGAALVVNSLTKTLAGHGAAMGGAVTDTGCFDWGSYSNIAAPFRKGSPKGWALTQLRKRGLRDVGAALSSEHAHQISLGMETASLRVAQSNQTAVQIANYLGSHRKVTSVNYPFLQSHLQNEIARRLFDGGSWLLSFTVGSHEECLRLVNALRIPAKSTGLGCGRSLVIPVASTIFWEMGHDERKEMGIEDGLIRYSVGLEPSVDLIDDLHRALQVF